jgi:sarcosine oxidase subunit alpha
VRTTKSRRETTGRRLSSLQRGREIVFFVNGRPTAAYEGETIHAALIGAGYRQLSKSKSGEPRGVFCGMGVCYECLVTVNKVPAQQACVTMVEAGMEVEIDDC